MISVIVPVYQVEQYLEECIESILSQTYTNFEVLLIDDGSTDNCPKICDAYAKEDNRIKVVHQKNQGLSAARNTGISIAKGEYLTFIDSDDVVTKRYLEILYSLLIKYKADIAQTGYKKIVNKMFEEGENYNTEYVVENKDEMCAKIYQFKGENDVLWVTTWGKLYKASLFINVRFPVGRTHEDQFTTYRLFSMSHKNVITNYPTYGYRQREGSIMHSHNISEAFDEVQGVENAVKYFQQKGMKKSERCANGYLMYAKAKQALIARNNGKLHNILKKDKMSSYDAIRIIEERLGKDMGEYVAYSLCPRAVQIYTLLKKLHLLH